MNSKADNELRYWFELADRLGYTVADLQASMSSWEFPRWVALDQIRSAESADARRKQELEYRASNPRRTMSPPRKRR